MLSAMTRKETILQTLKSLAAQIDDIQKQKNEIFSSALGKGVVVSNELHDLDGRRADLLAQQDRARKALSAEDE
jgi:hypothetical protein